MATIERDLKLATPTSIKIKPAVTVMITRREGIMIGDGHRMMVSSNTCHAQGEFGVHEPCVLSEVVVVEGGVMESGRRFNGGY
jgi:hypothetical protein